MSVFKKAMYYLIVLIILYAILVLIMYFNQAGFIYFPTKDLEGNPSSLGMPYEDVFLNTEDGVKIHGWFVPKLGSKRVLLHCHGNGGNISHRIEMIKLYNDIGLNTFIFDYRGYGKSEGKPTEKGTYNDAEAAWKYLIEIKKFKPENIIVLGNSLGGAVAAHLAMQNKPLALILDSAFTSVTDMARIHYPFFPIGLLPVYQYPTIKMLKKIHCPVLVIHSQDDEIVPFKLGKKLFEEAKEPKTFLEIKGSHNDGFFESYDLYKKGMSDFLKKLN